ncbi:hypothetical protein Entas_4482 (plasmid) [Enterobacter soli]|uniref:hypothetical protein n=1 Tax=Enterobacter soli TaxID=885040 RepID=UPI000223CE5C|nr:hypothetical protein [Enterobacter soli]AEN67178.1 hypothetical protein Entas_4482 [Enterobacter soli]OAT35088.1 hypothetical protein M987_04541 [Enterobacter soli ATCC BAA-2102]
MSVKTFTEEFKIEAVKQVTDYIQGRGMGKAETINPKRLTPVTTPSSKTLDLALLASPFRLAA